MDPNCLWSHRPKFTVSCTLIHLWSFEPNSLLVTWTFGPANPNVLPHTVKFIFGCIQECQFTFGLADLWSCGPNRSCPACIAECNVTCPCLVVNVQGLNALSNEQLTTALITATVYKAKVNLHETFAINQWQLATHIMHFHN